MKKICVYFVFRGFTTKQRMEIVQNWRLSSKPKEIKVYIRGSNEILLK